MIKKIFAAAAVFFIFSGTGFSQDASIESGKEKQKSGNHTGAIADFTGSINTHKEEVAKYLKQLEAFEKISPFDRAEKGMEAPPVNANLAVPYYLRGKSQSAMGKNDEALNDFNTAIKINPKLGAAYYERGRILWTTGKKDAGCIDLGTAASLKDSLAKELFDEHFCWKEAVVAQKEAASKLRLNDFQGVLDVIEPAIKLCPDSASYLAIRGRAYFGIGKYDLAMLDLEKAIALNQNCFDAYYGRGVAFLSKNKYQEAFDDLLKAIDINDKSPEAYLNRAYACEGMQKSQSALYDYQQAQKLKPNDATAFYKSGLLRNEMGDKKGACADFRRAAAIGHPEAADYAAQCKDK